MFIDCINTWLDDALLSVCPDCSDKYNIQPFLDEIYHLLCFVIILGKVSWGVKGSPEIRRPTPTRRVGGGVTEDKSRQQD